MLIEMGKGDIAIMHASTRDDRKADCITFVKRNKPYPLAIDVDCDVTDEEITNGRLGTIYFGHGKSIDALITQLQRLKENY